MYFTRNVKCNIQPFNEHNLEWYFGNFRWTSPITRVEHNGKRIAQGKEGCAAMCSQTSQQWSQLSRASGLFLSNDRIQWWTQISIHCVWTCCAYPESELDKKGEIFIHFLELSAIILHCFIKTNIYYRCKSAENAVAGFVYWLAFSIAWVGLKDCTMHYAANSKHE